MKKSYLHREKDFLNYIEVYNTTIARMDKFVSFDNGEKQMKELIDQLFKENECVKTKNNELIK